MNKTLQNRILLPSVSTLLSPIAERNAELAQAVDVIRVWVKRISNLMVIVNKLFEF